MPPGLVGADRSRIGALPTPVGDVIDALAVGEPIELALTVGGWQDPAAVEDAEATRPHHCWSLSSDGVEVRVAHPLYSAGAPKARAAVPGCGGCVAWSPPNSLPFR